MFTEIEYRYLSSHRYGRLASIGPDGAPQIHPVAFAVDPVTGCIEIGGPRLHETQKVRNIRRDPRVSLVVDEPAPEPVGPGEQFARGIEIRGAAALSQRRQPLAPGFGTDTIRITPARVAGYLTVKPPSMSRSAPLIIAAASDARKTAAAAISLG
jgi:pyridoxamine 5'-phosphate oxidase family protein